MEFGIFDFYKVFSRAFGEEGNGAAGTWNGRWGMSPHPRHAQTGSPRHPCSSGCYSYPKPVAAADVATNTVAFSNFYIYFASSFI